MVLTVSGQVSLTARAPTEVVQLVPTSGHLLPRWCDRKRNQLPSNSQPSRQLLYSLYNGTLQGLHISTMVIYLIF